MINSRYVKNVKKELEIWEKKLLLISDILDEWLVF
jgi:hypothetical protein